MIGPRFNRLGDYRIYRGETRQVVIQIQRTDGALVDLTGVQMVFRLVEHDGDPIGTDISATGVGNGMTFVLPSSLTATVDQVGTRYRVERGGQVMIERAFVITNGPIPLGLSGGDSDVLPLSVTGDVLVAVAMGAPGLSFAEQIGQTPQQLQTGYIAAATTAGTAAGGPAGASAGAAAVAPAIAAASAKITDTESARQLTLTATAAANDAAVAATAKAAVTETARAATVTATGLANDAATNANTKAAYAQTQGDYAKAQGDAIGNITAAVTSASQSATAADASRAAAAISAAQLSPIGEGGWAFAFVDQAGRTVGGIRPDGTAEFAKLLVPLASIVATMLSADVSGRLLGSSAVAPMLASLPDEASGGLAVVDQAGRRVLSVDPTGLVTLAKVALPASATVSDLPAVPVSQRLLAGAVGSFIQSMPDEAGYSFAVVDQNGRIGFGVPIAALPLVTTGVSYAARAGTADFATSTGGSSKWAGKAWGALGDSNTANGVWEPYVLAVHAMTLTNCGIGGSKIAKPDTDATTKISMCDDARVNALPAAAALVTLAGGTNDWAQNVPMGTLGSTDNTTFFGALNVMMTKVVARCTSARIVVITTPYGDYPDWANRSGWTSPIKNPLGFTYADYADAMRQTARLFGFPIIDWTAEAGINAANAASLMLAEAPAAGGLTGAHIHFADGGARLAASVVNGRLFDINPNS